MSTANAGWLYDHSPDRRRRRVHRLRRSTMTLDNGYGDWNESFKAYTQGSALH